MKQLLFGILLVLVSFNSLALTLKEKKKFVEWQAYVVDPKQSNDDDVEKKCGIKIPLELNENLVTPFMEANSNAASFCDHTRNAIQRMCGDATSKAAITAKIKKINCTLGKPGEVSFILSKEGILTFTVGVKSANLEKQAETFLENNL